MDITLHNAELAESNGQQAWMLALEVDRADGTPPQMIAAVLPTDTIEWRTAEYALDDLDDAELWSLAIHEAVAGPDPDAAADETSSGRDRYLQRHGGQKLKTRAKGQPRARLAPGRPLKAAGPTARVLVDSDLDDPIETILRHTPRRREHVEARRVIVEESRRRGRDAAPDRDAVVLQQAQKIKAHGRDVQREDRDR